MTKVEIIASYPPYGSHRGAIAGHALVGALRFNTIVPVAERKESVLARMKEEARGKKIWLDLKCRQLRITHFATLPYASVKLNHRIETNLPVVVLFKDGVGKEVEIVRDQELLFSNALFRIVGEGEPVNILDPQLRIRGFLTKSDKEYIAAARILTSLERQDVPSMQDLMHLELLYRMGYRRFMLSDRLCYEAGSFTLAMKAFERMLNHWSGAAVIP